MRGGHLLHVVDFAIGCGAAVIGVPVPTGDTLFGVAKLDDYRRARRSRRSDAGSLLVSAPARATAATTRTMRALMTLM